MFGFLPERIYDRIKGSEDFKAIQTVVEANKGKATTFKQSIELDSKWEEEGLYDTYKTRLEALITDICPQYVLEFQICEGRFTKEELLEMLKRTDIDNETIFFIISNIINNSYKDGEYEQYMYKYIETYKRLPADSVLNMSGYVHLKYMYSSCYLYAKDLYIDSNWLKLLCQFIKEAKAAALKYATTDTVNNYIIEAINDIIHVLGQKTTMENVKSFIDEITPFVDKLNFQYDCHSYGYAKFLDIKMMQDLYMRDYDSFLGGYNVLIKYMGQALLEPTKLFRGLNYYDKCCEGTFVILLRKLLKLKEAVFVFKNHDEYMIPNLSDEDKTFALSEFTDLNTPNNAYYEIMTLYKKDVDNWFANIPAAINNFNILVTRK